ncbi:hypothetical protein [Kribbella solani]|uniref:Uncharacterized protein n=1 Tax=Kribbella solani TaxID=236067 RepID=A0A841DNM3_9ACTN|nr:hypothetical protein [Kribbella solani]MBB5979491.1 hypothetical protein [Kribbella solani]MDX2974309.1 hypothetical protein [Kribbella solani]MDX3003167.1 hypothetical protein [Kribbella solani]
MAVDDTNGDGNVQDQPTEETPQQAVERQLRAAQEEVRQVAEKMRAALAENEERTKEGTDG